VGEIIGMHGPQDPTPPRRLPGCPSHVKSKAGRKLWRSVVRDYDLEDHQLVVLAEAAMCCDRLEQARASIVAHGIVTMSAARTLKPNPAVNVERDARIALARLLRELQLGDDADDLGADDFRLPRAG
jgi:phage terminase small subunit